MPDDTPCTSEQLLMIQERLNGIQASVTAIDNRGREMESNVARIEQKIEDMYAATERRSSRCMMRFTNMEAAIGGEGGEVGLGGRMVMAEKASDEIRRALRSHLRAAEEEDRALKWAKIGLLSSITSGVVVAIVGALLVYFLGHPGP